MRIGDFEIGAKTFIVAELSGNMNGSLETARRMVVAAKECGTDAVKVQTLDPFDMPDKDETVKEGVVSRWTGRRWLDVYKATYLPWLDQVALKRFAEDIGLTFFASVYSPAAVDFWERNGGLPAYKIAAWQARDSELIEYAAQTRRPVIIASDFERGFSIPWGAMHEWALLLKDTSHPILHVAQGLKLPIGFSNHGDPMQCVEAVKRGAVIVEQHFRIDEGLDTCAAMPEQFEAMVDGIREIEK